MPSYPSYETHDFCTLCSHWYPKENKHKPMIIDSENNRIVSLRDCRL